MERTGWTALALGAALAAAGCGDGAERAHPSGTLEVTEVDVAPLLTARVLEVRADEGDTVARGDTLVVLDTELIALQRTQAAARRALLDAQDVEAGEQLRQATRGLELAETTLARTRTLRGQGSATAQQVDDLAAARDVAASRVEAARARRTAIGADRVALDAALAVFDRQLRDGVVLAPLAGTVLLRAVEPGEVGRIGATALRVAALDTLELRVYLEAPDLDRVRIGATVPVLVDALDGAELAGTVSWVGAEAEFTPKNVQTQRARAQLVYPVKVRVANADGRLHPGMPAAVRLE